MPPPTGTRLAGRGGGRLPGIQSHPNPSLCPSPAYQPGLVPSLTSQSCSDNLKNTYSCFKTQILPAHHDLLGQGTHGS